MSKDIDELEQRIEQIKHKLIERDIHLNTCLGEHEVESFEAQYNGSSPLTKSYNLCSGRDEDSTASLLLGTN